MSMVAAAVSCWFFSRIFFSRQSARALWAIFALGPSRRRRGKEMRAIKIVDEHESGIKIEKNRKIHAAGTVDT